MKKTILLILLSVSTLLYGDEIFGPFPHERTDLSINMWGSFISKANATSGRYLYLGEVPKFAAEELEITISKMSLTSRVTAQVSQARIDAYAAQLYKRWKTVSDAVNDPNFSFQPLVKISDLVKNRNQNNLAWAKVAEQYSLHALESTGADIYRNQRNAKNFSDGSERDAYKETIKEAYFKFLFDTTLAATEYEGSTQLRDELVSVDNSRKLFEKHLGAHFTSTSDKEGYVGYLTLVYPIAATVAGPFDQPYENVYKMTVDGSIEARVWSDKWEDEFGGLPFLLIEWSGVAFHGPITNYTDLDVWFLRRGYVSHGCHRMDASDVLELRALMPADLVKAGGQIKINILNYFDVADTDNDGNLEATDVRYYNVPFGINVPAVKTNAQDTAEIKAEKKKQAIDKAIGPYLVSNQEKSYLKQNSFAAKFYDSETDTLKNIPKYIIGRTKIVKEGTHVQIPIRHFDYRKTRIIQYKEEGVKLRGQDDLAGKWYPKKFQQF